MAIVQMLLSGLGIYHLCRKPVPVFFHLLSKKMLCNTTLEPPLILLSFSCLAFFIK